MFISLQDLNIMTKVDITIAICTYNRSRLLKKCLDSLLPQLSEEIEIIVIDNNSHDETADVTKVYTTNYQNIRYLFEKNIGLSHARNRGIKESKAEWILYIDDDAMAFPDLVERALYLVNRGDFDCVGGMYYGYFDGAKPKWLPHDFGTKIKYCDFLTECPHHIPSGGIVLYRKVIFEQIGLFDFNLGMKQNSIFYGEETELQKRLFINNFKIGFDPELKIYHLIKRTTVISQLIQQFNKGFSVGHYEHRRIVLLLLKLIYSIFGLFVKRTPKNLYKLVFIRNFYFQNFILENFNPIFYYSGYIFKMFYKSKNIFHFI
jgi:glycosyltransferase involved in cell wall biosynthesis